MENVENDTTRFTPFIGSGIVCDNGDSKHFASNWHFDDCDQDQKVAIMNSALTSYSFDSFYKIIKKEIEVFELSRRKVTIVGLNLIKYVSENDEEFWEKETIEEKALIYFKEKDKLFELELCVEYTGCGSGYCGATVVEQSVTEIDKLPPMGYLVKELKEVPYDTVIGVNVVVSIPKYGSLMTMSGGLITEINPTTLKVQPEHHVGLTMSKNEPVREVLIKKTPGNKDVSQTFRVLKL